MKLLLILGVAFVPLLIAMGMYFGGLAQPESSANRGTLILPPGQLDELGLQTTAVEEDAGGEESTVEGGRYWQILVVSRSPCGDQCQAMLHKTRQVNIALGRERNRVIRRLVVDQPPSAEVSQMLTAEYPQLGIATGDTEAARRLLYRPGADALAEAMVTAYLVDPLGNIMMGYLPDQKGADLLKDLKKLLKLSRIG